MENQKKGFTEDLKSNSERKSNNNQGKEKVDLIIEYTKQGYDLIEIAILLKYKKSNISRIKRKYEKEHGWFTKQELEEFKRQRAIRELDNQDNKNGEQGLDCLSLVQDILKLQILAKHGFNNKEMADKMGCCDLKIRQLKRKAIELGKWFSDKDIKNFKEQRKIKERAQKNKESEKQNEDCKDLGVFKNYDEYSEIYEKLKKLAKLEDRNEYRGLENVSVDGRMNFANLLLKSFEKGNKISDEDTVLILNTIYLHPEIVNSSLLKLLILNANRKHGLEKAEELANELAYELAETRYHNYLYEIQKWIDNKRLLEKIKEGKKRGLNNSQIAKELNITSAEVVVILNGECIKMDSFVEKLDNR